MSSSSRPAEPQRWHTAGCSSRVPGKQIVSCHPLACACWSHRISCPWHCSSLTCTFQRSIWHPPTESKIVFIISVKVLTFAFFISRLHLNYVILIDHDSFSAKIIQGHHHCPSRHQVLTASWHWVNGSLNKTLQDKYASSSISSVEHFEVRSVASGHCHDIKIFVM